jgi:cobalamin biosynthesis protein CobD/CbiB
MSDQPPIIKGKPLSDEHKRLIALFDEMRKGQLTFLDEAGKRIIELSTGMLGILLAVAAFGKDFPPPYLKANPFVQILVVCTLAAFVLAVLAGVLTVQPREYDDYEHNLTEMRKQLKQIVTRKARWMKVANWLFFTGTVLLAVLIGILILGS